MYKKNVLNIRTIKQHIKNLTKEQFLLLKEMCKHSNSLYNCALYTTNKYYEETNKYIGYPELYNQMKNNFHYKSIPSKIAQQTLRLMDKDFRYFFALLKRKHQGKYSDVINSPKYKKKGSEFCLVKLFFFYRF